MKTKSVTKRVLSVILCTVMLFSCWVFSAPTAVAATTKYTVRLVGYCNNDYTPGTQRFYITYKTKNGTNSTTANTGWYSIGNEVGSRKSIWDSGGANYGYFPSDDGVEVDGFPISYTVNMTKTANGFLGISTDGEYYFKMQIKKANGWADYGGTQTNNGNITKDTYYKGYCEHHKKNSGKFNVTETSPTMAATDYPYAQAGGTISLSTSAVTLDGTNSKTVTATKPTANDQYNVTMDSSLCSLARSCSVSTTGISLSGTTVTCTKDAHIATKDKNQQTVTVSGSWSSANTSHSSVACTSASFTVTDEKYTQTWNYYQSSSTSTTGTAAKYTTNSTYYGDEVTLPTIPSTDEAKTRYYTTAKHYTGGNYNSHSGTQVLKANTFNMTGYTADNHSYSYTELASSDANYHSKHKGTCSCGYSTTFDHDYDTTTFTFADNGKTATAKRVCKTSGCKHEQSQSVTCTSAVKTAATCLEKGWTTYTATSPFGDGATGTKDVQDIDAFGHSWNPTTFTFSEDGTTAKATRVCKNDSNHIETQNATMSHAQKTAPTCTEKGWNTYTATSPFADDTASDTNDVQDIPATGHAYGDWADDGADNHKKVCANDPNHVETEAHTFSAWSVTVPEGDAKLAAAMKQDYDASAECFRYCTKCYRVEYQAHDYNSVRTEATCLDSGEIVYTCKYCLTTYNEDIPASGHDFELTAVKPNDKVSGYTCYHCKNCDNYWNAPYNSGYTEPDLDSETGIADPGQLNNSDTIPAPYFNDFKEDYDGDGNVDYAYGERGSGLKLMKNVGEFNAATTKQDFRFSGSVAIPKDISYEIGSRNDNVIKDFGFVYSQDSHIWNVNEGKADTDQLVLDSEDLKIASMSVVNNNAANGNVIAVNDSTGRLNGENGEWSGVTFHPGDGSDEFPDSLTFNLVISIKATNWKMQYAARPYITYTYHGETYTVYDNAANVTEDNQDGYFEYSCCSVYSLASYIAVWNPDNSAAKYCTDNILAHEALLYPTRFTADQKSDEFTDWWKWVEGDTSWSDFINPDRENSFYSAYSKFMKQ